MSDGCVDVFIADVSENPAEQKNVRRDPIDIRRRRRCISHIDLDARQPGSSSHHASIFCELDVQFDEQDFDIITPGVTG
jgi:hypothetical protein